MSRGVDPLAIDEPLVAALRTLALAGFTIGTPSRLHAQLEAMVAPGDLPKDAAKLVQVLARSAQVLADAGVIVQRHKLSGARLVQIVAVTPKPAPAAPIVRLEDAPSRPRAPRAPGGEEPASRRRGGMRCRGGGEDWPDYVPEYVRRAFGG